MSRINFNQFEESMTLSLATTEIYYTLISGTRQHFYAIYFNFCAKRLRSGFILLPLLCYRRFLRKQKVRHPNLFGTTHFPLFKFLQIFWNIINRYYGHGTLPKDVDVMNVVSFQHC